jgi:hypothetical protein
LIYRHTELVATYSIDVMFLAICEGRQSFIGTSQFLIAPHKSVAIGQCGLRARLGDK